MIVEASTQPAEHAKRLVSGLSPRIEEATNRANCCGCRVFGRECQRERAKD